jgi:drug/metabolite transporter (DMT)-like permease
VSRPDPVAARGRPIDRVGLVLCLVSAAGFGSLAIFGKQAYAGGLGVVGVLVLRFVVAAPLLVGLALVARRSLRVGWPTALRLLALGGIGYAIQATLFFNALARISAGLAALLLYLYPALVTAGAVALGRSRLDRATVGGLALSLAGIVGVLGLPGERLDGIGVALGLASAGWYTLYILVGEYLLRGVDPLAASAYVSSGAACSFLAAAVVAGGRGLAGATPSAYAWPWSAPPWPSPPSWPAWPGSGRPGRRSPPRSSRCSPSPLARPCSATGWGRARSPAGWRWSPARCCCPCSAGPERG